MRWTIRLALIAPIVIIGMAQSSLATSSVRSTSGVKDYMFVGGQGQLRLPKGKVRHVVVVATGAYDNDSNIKPVVVRNNTSGAVADIKVTGTAYVAGKLVATGSDQDILPYRVPRGKLAMGYVYFGRSLPPSARFVFDVTATPLSQLSFPSRQDMAIALARVAGGRLVGFAKNTSPKKVSGPIAVIGACFDTKGRLTGQESGFTDADSAPPGVRVSFTLDFTSYGTSPAPPCAHWLVTSSGFQF
jgi:hypothetical protein